MLKWCRWGPWKDGLSKYLYILVAFCQRGGTVSFREVYHVTFSWQLSYIFTVFTDVYSTFSFPGELRNLQLFFIFWIRCHWFEIFVAEELLHLWLQGHLAEQLEGWEALLQDRVTSLQVDGLGWCTPPDSKRPGCLITWQTPRIGQLHPVATKNLQEWHQHQHDKPDPQWWCRCFLWMLPPNQDLLKHNFYFCAFSWPVREFPSRFVWPTWPAHETGM